MEPTLHIDDRVLVNRFLYHFTDPSIGDIIVFHPPRGADFDRCGARHKPQTACSAPTQDQSDQNFIKRIVAGPGDTVKVLGGRAIINGEALDSANGAAALGSCVGSRGAPCTFRKPFTVPPEHYFMMGDHRDNSDDSRVWGPIPREWIIGQAFATYWPPDRIGIF